MSDADELYTKFWPEYFEVQGRDRVWYERLWGVLLRQIERRTSGRALVEFGSGPGYLLSFAHRRGWLALGVEPSGVARAHSEGLGVDAVERIVPPEFHGIFSAAIATEVLEHVENPGAALSEWRRVLAPGGLLALSVPNDENPLQRLFWGRAKPWRHPTHLSYFNPSSLAALVERSGYEVVWRGTSFPVELLLVLPIPRKWAWKLSRLWPAPPLLWRLAIGRHVLLVARKKDPAMTVTKLGHVGLTVNDLDRAEAFYRDLFGFETFFRVRRTTPWLAAQVGYKGADVEFCHMRGAGGLHLELLKYHFPNSPLPLPDDTFRPGSSHMNLWVDDVVSLTEKIRAYIAGMSDRGLARFAPDPLDIEASTITDGPQKGGKGYYMRDPDGHTIEVWQPGGTFETK